MHILFDLDGTLIDSAPSIVSALEMAFESLGVKPEVSPSPALVGPPLSELIDTLSPSLANDRKEALKEAFKAAYDKHNLLKFDVFPGIPKVLHELEQSAHGLYLLTNKRQQPTARILAHLGWTKRFRKVSTPDDLGTEELKTKTKLIKHFLAQTGLQPSQCIYIGDRDEDGVAAAQNTVPFLKVGWGYGETTGHPSIKSASDLIKKLHLHRTNLGGL